MIEKQPPTASVPGHTHPPAVPEVETNSVSSEPVQINEEQEDPDVFEDPTAPQEIPGLEPVIGTPQMTLADAVGAGNHW